MQSCLVTTWSRGGKESTQMDNPAPPWNVTDEVGETYVVHVTEDTVNHMFGATDCPAGLWHCGNRYGWGRSAELAVTDFCHKNIHRRVTDVLGPWGHPFPSIVDALSDNP